MTFRAILASAALAITALTTTALAALAHDTLAAIPAPTPGAGALILAAGLFVCKRNRP
jgi:hypothetical protein